MDNLVFQWSWDFCRHTILFSSFCSTNDHKHARLNDQLADLYGFYPIFKLFLWLYFFIICIPDCWDPRHSNRGLCSFRTVRRILDCRDPPDTLLLVSGQSGGSRTVRIIQTLYFWTVVSTQLGGSLTVGILRILYSSFRTVRSIPDCQDPPDTLLLGGVVSDSQEDPGLSGSFGHSARGLVVSGQSGGSRTVRILQTLCSWAV